MGDPTPRINGMVAVSRSLGDFFMEPYIISDPFVDEIQLTEVLHSISILSLSH
jgi:hypothetical protein